MTERDKEMESKDFINCEKISGEGDNALYNLFIYNELVAAAITWNEVMQRIEKVYRDEEDARM